MSLGRLGIAGVGLIGGSIALRARTLRVAVIGFDQDAATLARAHARGALDAIVPDLVSLARGCDTLVVALPVDAAVAALRALEGVAGPRLILDVASVKVALLAAAASLPNYIGTHPMAGREHGGIDAADAALFEHATWAHSPHPGADLVDATRAFIAAMGATPLQIEPAEHDAIVALTSHLPQALSVALGAELAAAAADDPRVLELCGPGMLSMLRLARSPQSVWAPIVAQNAGPLAGRLRRLERMLAAAAAALEAGECAPLMSYFASAGAAAGILEERFLPGSRS